MGREYSSSIYSGASGVWDGSTAVLYIVEHLECGREYSSSIYSGASGVWDGVQQFYI